MGALAAFQNTFAAALLAPEPATVWSALARQPGFAVYRNTVMKGCIDALQANYPAVARIAGEEWFRAAAALYVRDALPSDPALVNYGASFPAFLASFEPARELPYLPGVARLDRYWTEVHIARDDVPLSPAALSNLASKQLAATVLYPHSAARWAWFDDMPIYSIWARNRADEPLADEWTPDWHAEGALLTRTAATVQWCALDAPSHAFINTCANGATVAQAAAAALTANPATDLRQLMASLLGAGVFSRFSIIRR